MRAMIQLQNTSVQRGTKFLLDGADLTIYPGQKVGLIGANGTGKSTLFQLLLGKLHSDTGTLDIPKQWRVAHMAQEVGHTTRSALDYVLDGEKMHVTSYNNATSISVYDSLGNSHVMQSFFVKTTSPTTAMPHGMGRARADTVGRVIATRTRTIRAARGSRTRSSPGPTSCPCFSPPRPGCPSRCAPP